MIEKKSKYYFYLEPSVFLFRQENRLLVYDTNSFKSIRIENTGKELSALLNSLAKPEKMYSVLLTQKQLEDKETAGFISSIRGNYLGDIVPTHLCGKKPVSMTPILNFQKARNRNGRGEEKDYFTGENIIELLNEVNIHLDSNNGQAEMPDALIFSLLDMIQNYKTHIHFHGANPFGHKCFPVINSYLSGKKPVVHWNCDYLPFYETAMIQEFGVERVKLQISSPIDTNKLQSIVQYCNERNINATYKFYVEKPSDIAAAEESIRANDIGLSIIKPVFNNNLEFFEENVFLNEDDILESPVTKKQIFAHQTLNTYYFGKIHVKPNGDVLPGLHSPKIGNVLKLPLQKILYNEMKKGKTWFRIRNGEPCNKCVYQWLCPSPSGYETEIGRPNLCHVKP